jgi:outer membrane protein assembly factor BamB
LEYQSNIAEYREHGRAAHATELPPFRSRRIAHAYLAAGRIVAVMLLAGFVTTASAENWPRFRGPNGAGIAAPGFSTAITEKDFAWKVALPGMGHSSPVTWGEHVYLTSANDKAGRRYALCLAAADGKILWQYEEALAAYHKHRENSFASATPATDELGVYIAWTMPQEFTLLALTHDGKERWRKSLGRFQSQHGSGSSPIVVNDLVILNDDQEDSTSTIYAFDRASGALRWKVDRPGGGKAAMATPCVWRPENGPEQLIVATMEAGIQGLDLQSGKVLWQAEGVFFSRPIGSPVTFGDIVMAVNGEGAVKRVLIAIRPGTEQQPPQIVYKLEKVGPHVPTPLIKGENLFMWNDQGQLTCAKAATGEIVWSQKVAGNFYGSPICSGDVLWSISRSGDLIGVNVADGYKPVGTLNLGEASHATPAIADGRMYLRTVSHLICVKGRGNKD